MKNKVLIAFVAVFAFSLIGCGSKEEGMETTKGPKAGDASKPPAKDNANSVSPATAL